MSYEEEDTCVTMRYVYAIRLTYLCPCVCIHVHAHLGGVRLHTYEYLYDIRHLHTYEYLYDTNIQHFCFVLRDSDHPRYP